MKNDYGFADYITDVFEKLPERKMTVLIVDDDPIVLAMLKALVCCIEDCVPLCFPSSADALRWCGDHEPDLVLVDYMMPPPDGLEFIRIFRERKEREDVPIVMVTTDSEKGIRIRAIESGATDFLNKPVDKAELTARLRNLLSLRLNKKKLANHAAWLSEEVRKATAEILNREKETILRLSLASEYRDPETGAHIMRMMYYSEHIAKNLGLSRKETETILIASPMHDIGKVGIPDHILLKRGKLSEEEYEVMMQHSVIGYEILKESSAEILRSAALIALTHHEKYNGTGYPKKLLGKEIPLYGRIVAVADVFDALTSERPYKQAWELDAAITFIKNEIGCHFDPQCAEAFLSDMEPVVSIMNRYRDNLSSSERAGNVTLLKKRQDDCPAFHEQA